MCPPPPSSELSSLESLNDDELSSLESDVDVSAAAAAVAVFCPARRPPFSPSAHSPPEAALRSIPSSSNCASYPVSPYSQPVNPDSSSGHPSERMPCLLAFARTSPARSRSATARSSSTTHRSHLHRKPHTLASRVRRICNGSHIREVPYETVISSPGRIARSEYSVTTSSDTDTAAFGRHEWLHTLTCAKRRATYPVDADDSFPGPG